jgi:hypothetical protein
VLKTIIRLTFFITMALNVTQYVIGSLVFDHPSAFLLYIVALTVLYLFMKPLLTLISLPNEGPGYLFMSFLLTLITNYALTIFIPFFEIRSTTVSELIIFGFVLPSKRLNVTWSLVFSSLMMAVLMTFFNWLCDSRKK